MKKELGDLGVNFINILRERFLYESAFFAKILLPKPKRN